jgi:nitrite reductase/ring-hydroxylating ferredoxin subunit/uncharacterized membrane protein
MDGTSTAQANQTSHQLLGALERAEAVDGPAKAIANVVRDKIPPGTVKDLLSGTFLGHPIHPPLTDTVIGTWLSALILDLSRDRAVRRGADRLVAIGAAAALPAALTGANDWADAESGSDPVRRVGAIHASTNTAALGLQLASLAARRRGARGRAVALSATANGLLAFSGWLGGHLSFGRGIGVDQTVFDPGSDEWTPALPAADLPSDGPVTATVGDTPIFLVRDGAAIRAVHDRCSHRGCALSGGTIENGFVQCPCHGSRFALVDGAILRGPAVAPQPVFETRERDGQIEVRLEAGA